MKQPEVSKQSEAAGAAPELIVLSILRASQCSKCKTELESGSFLTLEKGQPLCVDCADLDHLVFLPRGDTALTRRARKHSSLSVVVVKFSRARQRYERQGVLVEEAALDKAQEECLSDEDVRARRRAREAERRQEGDQELVQGMVDKIRAFFPGCPPEEALAIARHTAVRGSGRVGRSAAGRALDEGALRLAVTASIRHKHTDYDKLLMRGWERSEARWAVRDKIHAVLSSWENPQAGNRPAVDGQTHPEAIDAISKTDLRPAMGSKRPGAR
jgi:hypothetical protein